MLQGKRAVIFGAGGSIGAAVAIEFAAEGAEVFLAGRIRSNVEAVAQRIGEAGHRAHVLATGDVAVARGTVRGTATGRQYGAPVTRRSFEASFFDYVRLEDGLIVERVQQADDQEAVVQELRTRREKVQNPPDLTKDLTTNESPISS